MLRIAKRPQKGDCKGLDSCIEQLTNGTTDADRLVFGCDLSMTASVGRIRSADLCASDREKILGRNMEAILKRRKA